MSKKDFKIEQKISENALLRVENLGKSYGENQLFSGINFSVGFGEILGILGSNGAGKSTLLNLISGFETTDFGQIFYNQKSISKLKPYEIARLGIVRTFQEGSLFSDLTVFENFKVAKYAKLPFLDYLQAEILNIFTPKTQKEIHEKQFLELLSRFGLQDLLHQKVGTLSTGQKRLVELLRLDLQEWDLLLLDEPLAGVSHHYFGSIKSFILEVLAQKKSVILVEHHQDFVLSLTDKVLRL